MKHLLIAAALAFASFGQADTDTAKIYILPMPGGFDQYLAVHLAESGKYRVVSDPAQATLLLTDRIGESFEQALKDLAEAPAAGSDTAADTFSRPRMQPLSRNRGTLFLVDRSSHQVLWSTFEEPKTTEPKELNKTARRIVERMK